MRPSVYGRGGDASAARLESEERRANRPVPHGIRDRATAIKGEDVKPSGAVRPEADGVVQDGRYGTESFSPLRSAGSRAAERAQ